MSSSMSKMPIISAVINNVSTRLRRLRCVSKCYQMNVLKYIVLVTILLNCGRRRSRANGAKHISECFYVKYLTSACVSSIKPSSPEKETERDMFLYRAYIAQVNSFFFLTQKRLSSLVLSLATALHINCCQSYWADELNACSPSSVVFCAITEEVCCSPG